MVLAAGCAAEPPGRPADAGSDAAPCLASDPFTAPRGAETLFSLTLLGGPSVTGARLLGSSSGAALAYIASPATSAFMKDAVPLRRYGAAGWSGLEALPEPAQHVGAIAASMTAGGDATFVWPSLDSADANSANLHALTVTATGLWSARATIGDTSVQWWQDPTVPVVGVASNEAVSIAAWTRIDPAGGTSTNGLWSSKGRPPGAWDPAQFAMPSSASVLALKALPDGTARAVWTSAPAGGALTLATAIWNGSGWSAPQVLAQAAAGAHVELRPSPGSSLGVATSGEVVVAYALVSPAALALLSVRSADGATWTSETLAELPTGSSWQSVANAAGQVFLTWGSPPDQSLHAALYWPGAGWTPLAGPSGVRNDEATIALADDGRFAIADSPAVAVPADCTSRTVVRVHRFAPGSGWSEPEIVDETPAISFVTALGYAGNDLLVLWQRRPGEVTTTFAASLGGP